jgi:hypothetical protein
VPVPANHEALLQGFSDSTKSFSDRKRERRKRELDLIKLGGSTP